MPTKRIIELLERHQKGLLTPEEQQLVDRWFENQGQPHNSLADMPDDVREHWVQDLYVSIQAENQQLSTAKTVIRPWKRWLPYAAAAMLVLAIGYFFLNGRQETLDKRLSAAEGILPGGNHATLTLGDGRIVQLDGSQTGIIIGNDDISYQDGTSLALYPNGGGRLDDIEGSDAIIHHSLNTPKGGIYSITLPDGSKVWLNAGSTLKYPSRFDGNERIVELEGEAYFEVRQKTSHLPFRVVTKGQVVEVLGTKFNVKAYGDEPAITTSLLEGKVRVTPQAQGAPVELLPGQQSKFANGQMQVGTADVSALVSWTKDVFIFQNTTLAEIMWQLERWYDVQYEGGTLPDVQYYAVISRSANLREVLTLLEETGDVRFQVKERRIMLQK